MDLAAGEDRNIQCATTVYVGSTSPAQLDFAKIRGHIHGGIPSRSGGVSLQLRGGQTIPRRFVIDRRE